MIAVAENHTMSCDSCDELLFGIAVGIIQSLFSMKYFGELEICHLSPDTLDATDNKKTFEVFNFYGSWIPGVSSGGCGNDGHSKI